jgi:hypothetical protein
MRAKMLACLALFLLFAISPAIAAWEKKPEFRWSQLYHYDTRETGHSLYTNRLSAMFTYLDKEEKPLFKLTPFLEIRRNIDKGLRERKELGVEIGKDVFPWLYLGDAIQETWIKEDYRTYTVYENKNHAESETRLMFSHSLIDKKNIKLKGFVLDEYTFDFYRGAGICNEVAIGVIMPVGKYIESGINWRHIDRIHHYDSDTCEAFITLVF